MKQEILDLPVEGRTVEEVILSIASTFKVDDKVSYELSKIVIRDYNGNRSTIFAYNQSIGDACSEAIALVENHEVSKNPVRYFQCCEETPDVSPPRVFVSYYIVIEKEG